jgi:lipopolysaccharide/colanic/teichoic acid biosynthesis glycosyltransferase
MATVLALLIVLALFLGGVAHTILSRLLSDEFKAWTPWLIDRITRHAICRLPQENRDRFGEEWRGHLNDVPGDIGKLVVALGFLWAARKMSAILRRKRSQSSFGKFLRRAFDLTASASMILLYAPLLVLLSLLVRLLNGGPVFYRSLRSGLNGQEFWLYKFRTIAVPRPGWPKCANPRPQLTRIGRFLREFKLDELPILFNVLRGDMSFVGPRPRYAGEMPRMSEGLPGYEELSKAKPGITGWAQMDPSFDAQEEIKYDLQYLQSRTLKADLRILYLAFLKVWKH